MIFLGKGGNISALTSSRRRYILYLHSSGAKAFSGSKSVLSDPTLTSTPKQERILKPQLPGDIMVWWAGSNSSCEIEADAW